MEISISSKSQKFVENQLPSDRFTDESELVDQAVLLMAEHEESLKSEIEKGLNSGSSEVWGKSEVLHAIALRAKKVGIVLPNQ